MNLHQVCRLAYELLQTRHPDASQRFVSLDDVYYYGGGNGMRQIAVLPHAPRNSEEIALRVGDELSLAGNHWNGWLKGKNLRTNKVRGFTWHVKPMNIQICISVFKRAALQIFSGGTVPFV